MNRKVVVFELPIYAAPSVEASKLLHAANIMAQYLDNDEDGVIDDPNVVDAMKNNNAFLFMWKTEAEQQLVTFSTSTLSQDLGNAETNPAWHANKTGTFDASLEEVWHIITHAGYAKAYPNVFGESTGTTIASAMDTARGGRHLTIPSSYPTAAWYTYDDSTCNYNCMVTEYFYWALTYILRCTSQ